MLTLCIPPILCKIARIFGNLANHGIPANGVFSLK